MATKLPYVLPFEDGSVVAAILLKAQGLPDVEQIATKTELQQATAYLATLDNATMAPQSATVKRETDNLQAQINNIVRAPESGGDVAAEVYQARVGEDSTVYPTLKARLDAEYNTQQETIDALKTGADLSNFTSGYYITENGLTEAADCIVSNPIVPQSRSITWINGNVTAGGRGKLVEFKSDDTVNGAWGSNGSDERTFTIKEDTAYIRATFFKDYASTDGLKYGSGTQEYFYKPEKTGVYGTDELFEITQQQKSELEILSDAVENLEVKEYIVPDYYEDQIAAKIEEIRTNMMVVGRNGETFVFITDLHWEMNNKNSPALVARLLDELNINLLVCGGDLINQSTDVTLMEQIMNLCVRSFNFKNTFFPCAFGNHDNNSNMGLDPQYHFTTDGVYALMQKQAENHVTYITTDKFNFYFDAAATRTRFIVCDTGTNGDFNKYDELTALLNNTPTGYKVVIVAHWLMQNQVKSAFANNLAIIIDAFNSRETCTIDGTSRDFTSANGEIVCAIAGHAHYDDSWTTPDGIPFIITDCDCGARTNNTDYPYVPGTITEQAFDVVTIDYVNRVIKCTRIGRGSDRTIEY